MPHDKNNNILAEGDLVHIPCRITEISQGERGCNLTLVAVEPSDDSTEYHPVIALNSRSVLKQANAIPAPTIEKFTDLNFGEAIAALKAGYAVARQGWNGKKMFVFLQRGSFDSENLMVWPNTFLFIEGIDARLFDKGDVGTVTRLPNLNMRAASGSTVTGWLASQTDILAEDWVVLNEPGDTE